MNRVIPLAETPARDATPFERIAIVGFGLMGGSIALAARARWAGGLIIAVDRKDVLEAAMRMHAADVAGDDLVMASDADLIVLAAPVRQNIAVLARLAEHVPGTALVTDVGSTKTATLAAAQHLPERLRFIGGHPLAGAASGGLEAARSDLFSGRPWLLTGGRGLDTEDMARLERFVTGLGASVHHVDGVAHDRLLAYLSHLPQLTVSALMHVVGSAIGEDGLALAGRGLRDTTRLAWSSPSIWRDIAATNPDALRAALGDLIATLQSLKGDLESGDDLERIFDSAAGWKAALEAVNRRPGEEEQT